MLRPPPISTLFPYTTLFRSMKFYPKGVVPKHAVTTDAMGGSQNLDIPSGEVVRTDGYTPFKTPVKITGLDRKSTRLNSSHLGISYAVFCLKKKKTKYRKVYR